MAGAGRNLGQVIAKAGGGAAVDVRSNTAEGGKSPIPSVGPGAARPWWLVTSDDASTRLVSVADC